MLQLTGVGEVFCAGADLAEMQAQAGASEADNVAHAEKLARLLGVFGFISETTRWRGSTATATAAHWD